MLRIEELGLGRLWKRYRTLVVYCSIGLTGALIDMTLFVLLTRKLGLYYQLANAISVTAGITNNFFWNARINFRTTDRILVRFISFYMIGLTGLALSAFLLFVLVGLLYLPPIPSKVATFVFIALIQFFLNKRISFRAIKERTK